MARTMRKQQKDGQASKQLPKWVVVVAIAIAVIVLVAVVVVCWQMSVESATLTNDAYEGMRDRQRQIGK